MKNIHNPTAGHLLVDALPDWNRGSKFSALKSGALKQLRGVATGWKKTAVTALTMAAVMMLFVGGSYLFLVQLSRYGW